MAQAPEGTWKVSEIAGFVVETEEGEALGVLKDVFGTGANDVFVVVDGTHEILVPALKSIVLKVLLSEKKIIVRLPKGLREVYAPPDNP